MRTRDTKIFAASVLEIRVLAAKTLLEDEEVAVDHGIDRRRRVVDDGFHLGTDGQERTVVVTRDVLGAMAARAMMVGGQIS